MTPKKATPKTEETADARATAKSQKDEAVKPGKGEVAKPEKAEAAPAKKGKRILVVEDEKPLAHALELKLSREGYDIVVANTGEDGLKEIQKGGFDLVLLDIILPGIDGFSVLEQAGAMKAKIIMLSNLGQEEDRKKAIELGAKNYLVKSNVPLMEIVKTVSQSF